LVLTEKGIKLCDEIFNKQKKRIINALKNSSSDEVSNFKSIMKKIING
jgi:DNA-binding MarR family transcriptional regulator